MSRIPGIAVIGAGLIGRRHIALVQASGRCRLAAICDPSPAAAELAEAAGVPHFAGVADLVAARWQRRETSLAGAVVATPNRDHVPSALKLVEAGVPALVEKPVADTLDDARALADAVSASGVPVLVGHHRRHSAALARARELIDSGALGRIVAVQGSATFRKPDDYFDVAPWRKRTGGGPILINMIHEIDDLRALCGDITAVQATSSSATRGFEVEDTVAMTLTFASGALGSFLLSDAAASGRSWELTSGENAAYPRQADENCYEVAGTTGALSIPSMTVRSYDGTPSWWEPMRVTRLALADVDPLAQQLDHFCDVLGGAPPLVTVADATRTLATTLAIVDAASSRREVVLGYDW
ncbi:Gfo/Idh/MocA family protein [Nocardioides sambongensis]|uniref:Gfo/Idh/MocA family protein n=1 Tax=Nocardioides sambongensis TaxID=2589074 RepID=UPI00112BF900|nr:Gfo/Idh/MocA family oxidoreductase [Nocardioides sambongensis]